MLEIVRAGLIYCRLIDCFQWDEAAALSGQFAVDTYIEAQLLAFGVELIHPAVAVAVQHDRAVGLPVPTDQRIVTQRQE